MIETKKRKSFQQASLPPNPFPEDSYGYQLWEMGYHDKELIDSSLSRNSSLEGALSWIEERRANGGRKSEFHCSLLDRAFDTQDLYIFDW
jgi:hypothetical protein